MSERIPVIAIFDIGKTNKKLLLFNEQYDVLHDETIQLPETTDEDGFPCEDIRTLSDWVTTRFFAIRQDPRFEIRAVNYSGYGASFVYLDENRDVIGPLYNYLKPFPPALLQKFYSDYGGEDHFSKVTASPVLGNLNSGMQLYRLKYERPEVFERIKYALHLPQYLCFLLTGSLHSDITSVGCHTNLWNFGRMDYHEWVRKETIEEKLAPLFSCEGIAGFANGSVPSGVGLHDSSAALIPYYDPSNVPFVLISTGTWCISLNPFNHSPLTGDELKQDCLCYLSYTGEPIKAARLFAGDEHEKHIRHLAAHFTRPVEYYSTVKADLNFHDQAVPKEWKSCGTYEEAYHRIMAGIIQQQKRSTDLVLKGAEVKTIYVDGGFSKNPIYMHMLAEAYAGMEVVAASVPQASALGAAMVIDRHWNTKNPLYADKGY